VLWLKSPIRQFNSFLQPVLVMLAQPLAISGVISSTLLTLVVIPVAYSLLARWLRVPGKEGVGQKVV